MKTAAEINSEIGQFIGTEKYYRYLGGLLLTDGAKWLADSAECYWLLDIIASYQPTCRKDPMLINMQFWKMKVNLAKKTAVVTCERDAGDVVIEQKIDSTNFPLEKIEIWVERGDEKAWVAMLPSER